jgi:hypothetical protein
MESGKSGKSLLVPKVMDLLSRTLQSKSGYDEGFARSIKKNDDGYTILMRLQYTNENTLPSMANGASSIRGIRQANLAQFPSRPHSHHTYNIHPHGLHRRQTCTLTWKNNNKDHLSCFASLYRLFPQRRAALAPSETAIATTVG